MVYDRGNSIGMRNRVRFPYEFIRENYINSRVINDTGEFNDVTVGNSTLCSLLISPSGLILDMIVY